MEKSGEKKAVAILGAGPSGLVAAKEALENGLIPTIFEKEASLGGVWNEKTGSVWKTMHTNISKFTTTFGDTFWSKDHEMFPTASEMSSYLNDYAEKWGLRKLINYNSTIVKVSADLGENRKKWTVKWSQGPQIHSGVFDGVIVATGIFAVGNIPTLSGVESFPGKIIHSREYKCGKEYLGKRVLTLGGSFSGAEIATDVATWAEMSIHSFRSPFWILNRYLPTKNGTKIPIDLLFYTRKFYAQPPSPNLTLEDSNRAKNKNMAGFCKEQEGFEALKIAEEWYSKPINVVISDKYLSQIRAGKLTPKNSKIVKIQGSDVIFENGDRIKVDVIIFGTGFNLDLNFLDDDILKKISYDKSDRLQPLILFNATAHPDLENLFFVGMYKGPYFGVMEQQARWACRLLSGKVQIPPPEVILEGLRKEKNIREQMPRPQFPHGDYVFFADSIATCGNSFPDLEKLQSEKYTLAEALAREDIATSSLENRKMEIANLFMNAPVTPAHYNLKDNPSEAVKQMDIVQQIV